TGTTPQARTVRRRREEASVSPIYPERATRVEGSGHRRRRVERHERALLRHRFSCRLEQAYDAEAGLSIGRRSRFLFNTVDEVSGFGLQRFGEAKLRRPHVAS